jgi:hypothetical protein
VRILVTAILAAVLAAASASGTAWAASTPGPRITFRVSDTELVLGDRARLSGRISRLADPGGRTIRIEADAWPFDRFRTLRTIHTRADGSFSTRIHPDRNVRIRVVARLSKPLRPRALTVWTSLPSTIRRHDAGTATPRVTVQLTAPPGAAVRGREPVFYLATADDGSWQRIVAGAWTVSGTRTLTATAAYPAGRLGPRDRVLVCTRERRPDPYGQPTALERNCGDATLPRAAAD